MCGGCAQFPLYGGADEYCWKWEVDGGGTLNWLLGNGGGGRLVSGALGKGFVGGG